MRRKLRTTVLLGTLFSSAFAIPQAANATQVSFELRHTPMRIRPNDTPSLCPMLALSLSDHWWAGTGYELVQDYDAVLWTSQYVGHKPIVMSGIRAGTWYRGGPSRDGMAYSIGGLFTFASPALSPDRSPKGIDNGTWIVDFGADFTLGYVWTRVRLGVFATPAWSYGRVSSPAVQRSERYSAFTYRVGLAFAVALGQ
jgi:hypothetical protein